MRSFIIGTALLASLVVPPVTSSRVDDLCYPGQTCFPTNNEVVGELQSTLEQTMSYPVDELYHSMVVMRNIPTTKFPFAIVRATSTEDVKKAILFAKKYNLRVTVRSSGHDFNGRSTAHGSLQINLEMMNKTKVNLNSNRNAAGEIRCESGNTWLKVYEEVDKYNRVIIGGSAHTVSMGGYTLGGGHSPMSRMFGLAVDNLLEIEMVDTNGNIVIANDHFTHIKYVNGSETNSTNTDIFWALRGGGGGTFGIVTTFTFKLHHAAPAVVQFICSFPIYRSDGTKIGFEVLRKLTDLIPGLPKQWGGYFFVNDVTATNGTRGTISTFMNHYGAYDTTTRAYMDQFKGFHTEWQQNCLYVNKSSFLDYEVTAKDAEFSSTYIIGSLLQNNSLTDELVNFLINKALDGYPTTGILLGGTMMDVGIHDTSVHPGFRSALVSAGMSRSFDFSIGDYDSFIADTIKVGDELAKFGDGMYPNESGADVKNWKSKFWGSNYHRLMQIKKIWDPDNFLTCRECVGSDLSGINDYPTHTNQASHLTNLQEILGK